MSKHLSFICLVFLLIGCEDKLSKVNPMAPYVDSIKQSEKAPIITLLGANPHSINQGEKYLEPGYKAQDSAGKDLTSAVLTSNNINASAAGNYLVKYNVKDEQGKAAVEVLRSVVVKAPLNTSNGVIKEYTRANYGSSPYEYYEYLPKGYDQNPALQYPLVIFLHGLGEQGGYNASGTRSGVALSNVLRHGPLKRVKAGVHFPAIIVHPQTPVWWNASTIKKFLDVLKAKYRVNSKRIYVTGLSMGGGGTWDFARAYPNEVAAIVPICGASSIGSVNQAKPLLPIPVWAFHAKGDPTVSLSNSYSFLNWIYTATTGKTDKIATYYANASTTKTAALEDKLNWIIYEGVNPGSSQDKLLTIYPHSSHDSWSETYNQQKMWDWLFSQSRP